MKRTIVLIAIVSLVPSTAGCGNPSTNTPSGVPLKHKIDFKVPKGWELQAQGTTLMKCQWWSDEYKFIWRGAFKGEAECAEQFQKQRYPFDVQYIPACTELFVMKGATLGGMLGGGGIMSQLREFGFDLLPNDRHGMRAYNSARNLGAGGYSRKRMLIGQKPEPDYLRSIWISIFNPPPGFGQ